MRSDQVIHEADTSATSEKRERRWQAAWPFLALKSAILLTFAARFAEGRRLDHDVFHALSLWRQTMILGRVPTTDVWAYTQTVNPVVHHEWLTGGLNYWLAIVTGWGADGLLLWRGLCCIGALVCAAVVARLRGADAFAVAIGTVMATMLSMVSVGTGRAQVTTVFLFALLLLLLELDRHGNRIWILAWLCIFPVWMNLHGGVVAGCGALFLHTVESTWRSMRQSDSWKTAFWLTSHLWLTGLALFPLFLLNPYGLQYVTYLVSALTLDRSHINEWWPIYRTLSPLRLAFFAAMVGTIGYAARYGNLKRQPGFLLLAVLTFVALKQTRQVCFFSIAWLAYIPASLWRTEFGSRLTRLWPDHRKRIGTIAIAWSLIMLLQIRVLGIPWEVRIPTTNGPSYFPTGLVEYLEENNFEGNIVTSFETGAWLSWKLYPQIKVSIDSRYEAAFAPQVFQDTVCFYRAEQGWKEALARLGGDAVVIPNCYKIAEVWFEDPPSGWKIAYQDDAQTLVTRRSSASPVMYVDRRGASLNDEVF